MNLSNLSPMSFANAIPVIGCGTTVTSILVASTDTSISKEAWADAKVGIAAQSTYLFALLVLSP
jgi:hypothetical protein